MTEYRWNYTAKTAYNNRMGRYRTDIQSKFIMDNADNKFERIFDIAGGSGRFAVPLSEYSKDITVLDINETALKLLKERNKDIKTYCGDFIETDVPGKFSLITCIEALDYFKDWKQYFAKVDSLLDKDGRFIFTYTNPDSWRFFLRTIKHEKDPYTRKPFSELKSILESTGFEIIDIKGMNWMPFAVTSNNIIVPVLAFFEKIFSLNRWLSQSPWILIAIKKKTNAKLTALVTSTINLYFYLQNIVLSSTSCIENLTI